MYPDLEVSIDMEKWVQQNMHRVKDYLVFFSIYNIEDNLTSGW